MADDRNHRRFSGEDDDGGKQLKRWRQWATAKTLTMKDLKKDQRGPFLLTLLDGAAWDCCEHITIDQLHTEGGEDTIWKTLSERFPEREAQDIMGEALGDAFNLAAQDGESMKLWTAADEPVLTSPSRPGDGWHFTAAA